MNDESHLFHLAETHWAARAARGRIDAINASPSLQWQVQVRDGAGVATLTFNTSPTRVQIALRMRDEGLTGQVDVLAITVGRKRRRALLLMPWMRAKMN